VTRYPSRLGVLESVSLSCHEQESSARDKNDAFSHRTRLSNTFLRESARPSVERRGGIERAPATRSSRLFRDILLNRVEQRDPFTSGRWKALRPEHQTHCRRRLLITAVLTASFKSTLALLRAARVDEGPTPSAFASL